MIEEKKYCVFCKKELGKHVADLYPLTLDKIMGKDNRLIHLPKEFYRVYWNVSSYRGTSPVCLRCFEILSCIFDINISQILRNFSYLKKYSFDQLRQLIQIFNEIGYEILYFIPPMRKT